MESLELYYPVGESALYTLPCTLSPTAGSGTQPRTRIVLTPLVYHSMYSLRKHVKLFMFGKSSWELIHILVLLRSHCILYSVLLKRLF